jgi:hypothetical protein
MARAVDFVLAHDVSVSVGPEGPQQRSEDRGKKSINQLSPLRSQTGYVPGGILHMQTTQPAGSRNVTLELSSEIMILGGGLFCASIMFNASNVEHFGKEFLSQNGYGTYIINEYINKKIIQFFIDIFYI